jgi:hypothetical protein
MAAQEGELEGRLRELHTWDTQLAAKQQAVDEYINLVGDSLLVLHCAMRVCW